MVRLRRGGHRSPQGAVARVRGVHANLHQPQRPRQCSAAAHAQLPEEQRTQAFPGPAEAVGGHVGEEGLAVRPTLAVVPYQRPQAHGGAQNDRLRAARGLHLVREGGGGQPPQGRRGQGQGPARGGVQAFGQQRLRQVHRGGGAAEPNPLHLQRGRGGQASPLRLVH